MATISLSSELAQHVATAAIIQGVASIQINMVIPVIESPTKDFSVYAILQMVVQLLHLMILERVEILSPQMGLMVLKVCRFCRLITYQPCLLITSNMQGLICYVGGISPSRPTGIPPENCIIICCRELNYYMYRVYANKTHDLITARKFLLVLGFFIVYLNGVCDDLYQKIT